jgi:hypothetical protein
LICEPSGALIRAILGMKSRFSRYFPVEHGSGTGQAAGHRSSRKVGNFDQCDPVAPDRQRQPAVL